MVSYSFQVDTIVLFIHSSPKKLKFSKVAFLLEKIVSSGQGILMLPNVHSANNSVLHVIVLLQWCLGPLSLNILASAT